MFFPKKTGQAENLTRQALSAKRVEPVVPTVLSFSWRTKAPGGRTQAVTSGSQQDHPRDKPRVHESSTPQATVELFQPFWSPLF